MALMETIGSSVLFLFAALVPGYFLTLAFFPSRKEIGMLERFAFSLFFSIAFLAIAVLVENQLLGMPLNFFSVAATIFGMIALGLAVYLIRSQRINAPEFIYRLFPKIDKNDSAGIIPKLD